MRKHIKLYEDFVNEGADEDVQQALDSIRQSIGDEDEINADEWEDFEATEKSGTITFSGTAFIGSVKGSWSKSRGIEMVMKVDNEFADFFGGKPQTLTYKSKPRSAEDVGGEINEPVRALNDINSHAEEYNGFEKKSDVEKFLKTYGLSMSLKDFVNESSSRKL